MMNLYICIIIDRWCFLASLTHKLTHILSHLVHNFSTILFNSKKNIVKVVSLTIRPNFFYFIYVPYSSLSYLFWGTSWFNDINIFQVHIYSFGKGALLLFDSFPNLLPYLIHLGKILCLLIDHGLKTFFQVYIHVVCGKEICYYLHLYPKLTSFL